jgi:hypothetical protein
MKVGYQILADLQ